MIRCSGHKLNYQNTLRQMSDFDSLCTLLTLLLNWPLETKSNFKSFHTEPVYVIRPEMSRVGLPEKLKNGAHHSNTSLSAMQTPSGFKINKFSWIRIDNIFIAVSEFTTLKCWFTGRNYWAGKEMKATEMESRARFMYGGTWLCLWKQKSVLTDSGEICTFQRLSKMWSI